MTLAEKLRKEGFEQGIRVGDLSGLIEAVELGLTLRFGDQSLKLMPFITQIKDTDRLRSIKDAIKTVRDVSDIKAMI
ncbi:MAG: hypothetical protein GY795_46450 [Desulfobacterales bacterium]|nr:hypothetical protein [Desulfobacterales bacterium]